MPKTLATIVLDKKEAKGKIELVEHPYGVILLVDSRKLALLDLFYLADINANEKLEQAVRLVIYGRTGEPIIIVKFGKRISLSLDKRVLRLRPAFFSQIDEYMEEE